MLEATQVVTPVPGAADVPAALASTFRAIECLNDGERGGWSDNPGLRHHLHRILDHLSGVDHSGCSGKPGAADYGRPEEARP